MEVGRFIRGVVGRADGAPAAATGGADSFLELQRVLGESRSLLGSTGAPPAPDGGSHRGIHPAPPQPGAQGLAISLARPK